MKKKGSTMFKNLKIGQKIYIPLILSIVVATVIIAVNSFDSIEHIKEDVFAKERRALSTYFPQKYEAKRQIGLTNAINIANNLYVIRALRDCGMGTALWRSGVSPESMTNSNNIPISKISKSMSIPPICTLSCVCGNPKSMETI